MFYYAKEDQDIGFDGMMVSETEMTAFPDDGYKYVRIFSADEYFPGATGACYGADGRLLDIVTCVQNGLMRMPKGKRISEGRLAIADLPDADAQARASRIMFRALAQTDVIKPADALDNAGMFPLWADSIGQRAEAGSYWRHTDKLYRVNTGQGHTIQADWPPDQAASLFSLAANPADEWPEWIQPTGAHNAYAKGAKVTHGGKKWVSTAGGNVYEPGVYGWEVSA